MPFGSRVTLAIYSTWGDEYFVGLNGIEIFDSEGQALAFGRGIASVECLKGYSADDADDSQELADHDPRVVANLVNGNNFTCDDLQVWLAPYFKNTAGSKDEKRNGPLLSIEISMSNPVTVAMIRLFNYNKSRTHSVRGVRHFQLLVDGVPVYSG
jgi:hypothetical protein